MAVPKPSKTEAIANFLHASTHADLANRYHAGMEVQVNVAPDGGTQVEGTYLGRQWNGFQGPEGQVWKAIRIPWKANTEPEFVDSPMSYDLAAHADGIGMTGWNWQERRSEWWGFDFDAIKGHAETHNRKLTDAELREVQQMVAEIPWVTVRRSTSGKGLHLYVYCEGFATSNHNEHAAVARAILSHMSAIVGFDFQGKADTMGGNMWIWHRKMIGTDGLSLLKQGSEIPISEIPVNWRDHVQVVSGKRARNMPQFISEMQPLFSDADKIFEQICGQRLNIPLDVEHRKLIDYLQENGCRWWWDSDYHMLVTHTIHLKEAHDALSLKGIFETVAQGTERGSDHNCFAGIDEVLTVEGPKRFRDAVGPQRLLVHTDRGYEWIEAEIRSFGIQKTYPMYLGDGSVYHPTANHRWLYRDQNTKTIRWDRFKFTHELIEGKTQLPLAPIELPAVDDHYHRGYAHGFVYGDGWRVHEQDGKRHQPHCDVALFKRDVDLLNTLLRFGQSGQQQYEGHGYIQMVRHLPYQWKELPESCSKSYALGFVLGMTSADGSVPSCVQIFQSDFPALEEIRKLAIFAGLRCSPIRPHGEGSYENSKQSWALTINTYNLEMDHLIRKDQQAGFSKRQKCLTTTPSWIDWEHPTTEEVFCAVVPHWQNFTLANGVLTRNCYAFPLRDGAWVVRRYSPGCGESPSWDQDQAGYTRCYYNRKPDLKTAARACEGVEQLTGSFHFSNGDMAEKAAGMLGVSLGIPPDMRNRTVELKQKEGLIGVDLQGFAQVDNASAMKGWAIKSGKWKKTVQVVTQQGDSSNMINYDDTVRHLVNESDEDSGWIIKSDNTWRDEPYKHVQVAIESTGFSAKDSKVVMGTAVLRPWRIVNIPFGPEYPGDRSWNRNAARFNVSPAEEIDPAGCPHWMKMLSHLGKGLDDAIQENGWCAANGIKSGAVYLKTWIASMIQQPLEQLPYLFFYSPEENTGKSSFHESMSFLIRNGIEFADTALTQQQTFNAELAKAVLCVVEETSLQNHKQALARIRAWVTNKRFPVHPKFGTPYSTPNSTHWVQFSNDLRACPIFQGDTRITMLTIQPLEPTEIIPKRLFFERLEKEAPYFLAELLRLELPPSNDRLAIPIITTSEKQALQAMNETLLETFLREKIYHIPGELIPINEMWEKFYGWMDEHDRDKYSKIMMGKEMPNKYPKGRWKADWYYGNVSFEPKKPGAAQLPAWIVRGEKLVQLASKVS
jgi:hypothetical protein